MSLKQGLLVLVGCCYHSGPSYLLDTMELDLMILMGRFQLRIFYDSMTSKAQMVLKNNWPSIQSSSRGVKPYSPATPWIAVPTGNFGFCKVGKPQLPAREWWLGTSKERDIHLAFTKYHSAANLPPWRWRVISFLASSSIRKNVTFRSRNAQILGFSCTNSETLPDLLFPCCEYEGYQHIRYLPQTPALQWISLP